MQAGFESSEAWWKVNRQLTKARIPGETLKGLLDAGGKKRSPTGSIGCRSPNSGEWKAQFGPLGIPEAEEGHSRH